MKLFKVKGKTSVINEGSIFFAYVLAENAEVARSIVEDEIWCLGGMEIISISEENTDWHRLLCICSEKDT